MSRQLYTVYTQIFWVSKQGNCTILITTVKVTGELTVDRYEGIQNFEFSIPKNDEKAMKLIEKAVEKSNENTEKLQNNIET